MMVMTDERWKMRGKRYEIKDERWDTMMIMKDNNDERLLWWWEGRGKRLEIRDERWWWWKMRVVRWYWRWWNMRDEIWAIMMMMGNRYDMRNERSEMVITRDLFFLNWTTKQFLEGLSNGQIWPNVTLLNNLKLYENANFSTNSQKKHKHVI